MSDDADRMLKALRDEKFVWRTVRGLSAEIGIPGDAVVGILTQLGEEVIQSSVPSKDGEALYASKSHFRKHGRTIGKILGAFKGRVR